MKALKIDTACNIYIIQFDVPINKWLDRLLGGYPEHVRPIGLDRPYCMMVDDEGLCKGLSENPVGCTLYGGTIAGDIYIMKDIPDGAEPYVSVGLDDQDIALLLPKIKKIRASFKKNGGWAMIITNKKGLPQSFVEMAQRDYVLGPKEYRVTSLLKGVRETILERRHDAEIERDVSDMIWLLFGTAVHGILERQQEGADQLKEERLKIEFDGYVLSGQFDLYDGAAAAVTDYKTASVWKIMFRNYDDWRKQLLIYAYMLRSIGFPVSSGEIVALLKDHSKRDAKIKADYPPLPVERLCFTFSEEDFQEIESFLHKRFAEIKAAEALPDDQLPVCTPEERFNSGDKFAVKKKGRKTALRVLDSLEAAQAWMRANGGDEIEARPGEDKKCLEYCSCNQFCSFYLEHVRKGVQDGKS